MLTLENFNVLQENLTALCAFFMATRVTNQPLEDPGPKVKFLGVVWLGKTHLIWGILLDKVQQFPTLKNSKRNPNICGILGLLESIHLTFSPAFETII